MLAPLVRSARALAAPWRAQLRASMATYVKVDKDGRETTVHPEDLLHRVKQCLRSTPLLGDAAAARREWVQDAIDNPVTVQLTDSVGECRWWCGTNTEVVGGQCSANGALGGA